MNIENQYKVTPDMIINVYAKIKDNRPGIDYVPKMVELNILYQIKDEGREILDANIMFSDYQKY